MPNLVNKIAIPHQTSDYIGVRRSSTGMRWTAEILIAGTIKYLGSFTNEVEAAEAYDTKCFEIYGGTGIFNFPDTFIKDTDNTIQWAPVV